MACSVVVQVSIEQLFRAMDTTLFQGLPWFSNLKIGRRSEYVPLLGVGAVIYNVMLYNII